MAKENTEDVDIDEGDLTRDWEALLEGDRYNDSNEKLERYFGDYKKTWNKRMKGLFPRLRDFDSITDVETDYLSYRHQVNDTLFTLLGKLSKKTQLQKILKKELMLHDALKQFRTQRDKKKYIEAYLSGLQRQIELLEAFIDFCRSMISTLDKVSFAIKHRIRYEEMK